MHLTTAQYLVLFGAIASTFALTGYISDKLKVKEAASPQGDANTLAARRKFERLSSAIPIVLALIAWCLAALFHWANWDPLSLVPPGRGKILFVAFMIVLAAAAQGILIRSRFRFIRRRKAESGSLSEKDIAGLKKLDAFIWKSSLFLAACIAVIALLKR